MVPGAESDWSAFGGPRSAPTRGFSEEAVIYIYLFIFHQLMGLPLRDFAPQSITMHNSSPQNSVQNKEGERVGILKFAYC
jgi:hypothetical protein